MRVLVTGGAGYIGSHACKALARAGHEPVTFDNLSTGHRWAVRWGPLIVGDLGDGDVVRRTLREQGVQAVMHLAASGYVGVSISEPRAYYANNLANGLALLDAMLDSNIRLLIFSSSCAIFGTQQTALIDETHRQEPVNPYGETKRAFEQALRWYDRGYGLRSIALRYFNAAGADPERETGEEHEPEPHLIPNILSTAAGARPYLSIFGDDYPTPDGTAVRDYVHVSDLASAHVLALEHLAGGGPSLQLNLGTSRGHSVREVVNAAAAVCGAEIPTRISARREGDPPLLVADGRVAQQTLGWTPRHSDLASILRSAWRWHSSRAPGRGA